MKGELYKTENGWGVKYFDHQEAHDVMYCGVRYPLHPDSIGKRDFGILVEGSTVDFEVVNVYVEPSSDIHSNRGADVPHAKLYKTENHNTEKKIIVKSCYHSCPFFTVNGNTMECGHPHFDDKNSWDGLIITQDNSRGRVPDECPLRVDVLTITYSLG